MTVFHLSFDFNKLIKVKSSLNQWHKFFSYYLILRLFDNELAWIDLCEDGPYPGIKTKHCLDTFFSKCCVNGTHTTKWMASNYELVEIHCGIWTETERIWYHICLVVNVINHGNSLSQSDLEFRYPIVPFIRILQTTPIFIVSALQPWVVARTIMMVYTEHYVAMWSKVSTATWLKCPTAGKTMRIRHWYQLLALCFIICPENFCQRSILNS